MKASAARGTPGYLCQLSAAVLACVSVPQLVNAQSGAAEPAEEIIVTSSIIAQPRRQIPLITFSTSLAIGEWVTDLLPTTPSRKVPAQFDTRILPGRYS